MHWLEWEEERKGCSEWGGGGRERKIKHNHTRSTELTMFRSQYGEVWYIDMCSLEVTWEFLPVHTVEFLIICTKYINFNFSCTNWLEYVNYRIFRKMYMIKLRFVRSDEKKIVCKWFLYMEVHMLVSCIVSRVTINHKNMFNTRMHVARLVQVWACSVVESIWNST